MACILNIETATPLCSVALAIDGKVIALRETLEERSHAARLTVFIEEMLAEQKIRLSDLDAVAVGKGPGSYTGLRIGVSTAKGICYGIKIPLIAVNTLGIMFRQVLTGNGHGFQDVTFSPDTLFCPMIDARRMEVFTCLFNQMGEELEPVSARIIDQDSFRLQLTEHPIAFFGTGMEKCKSLIFHPNGIFIPEIYPHSSALAILSEEKYMQCAFENIAYFEPFYLKDFVATVSKKGLLT
jgi:tRNA threonylcarbamoyladenosine biosynthesis protein TsaB